MATDTDQVAEELGALLANEADEYDPPKRRSAKRRAPKRPAANAAAAKYAAECAARDALSPNAPSSAAAAAGEEREEGLVHSSLCSSCAQAQERDQASRLAPKACANCGDELAQEVVVHGAVDSDPEEAKKPGVGERAHRFFITGPRYKNISVELYDEWGNRFRRWGLESKLTEKAEKHLSGRTINIRVQRELFDDGDEPMRYTWWADGPDKKELTVVLSGQRRGGEVPRTRDEILANFLSATDDVRRRDRSAAHASESSADAADGSEEG